MKTSSEYRALAWKTLRKNFADSTVIVIITALLAAAVLAIIMGGAVLCAETDHGALLGVLCMIAGLMLNCILVYTLYVWFLSLVRREPMYKISENGWGRAFLCGLALLFSSLVQAPFQPLTQRYPVFALLALPLLVFVFWYMYACSMLPFIAHDRREISVWQSFRQSVRMMDGYKMKLFAVDFKIIVWPVLAYFGTMLLTALITIGAKGEGAAGIGTGSYLILALCLSALFVLVVIFVLLPMYYIAHALFYEDRKTELAPVDANETSDNQ